MVYTYDSKSYGRKSMRVRLPLPAQKEIRRVGSNIPPKAEEKKRENF